MWLSGGLKGQSHIPSGCHHGPQSLATPNQLMGLERGWSPFWGWSLSVPRPGVSDVSLMALVYWPALLGFSSTEVDGENFSRNFCLRSALQMLRGKPQGSS